MMASKLQHGALQDDCILKTLEFFFTFSPSTLRLLHVLLLQLLSSRNVWPDLGNLKCKQIAASTSLLSASTVLHHDIKSECRILKPDDDGITLKRILGSYD